MADRSAELDSILFGNGQSDRQGKLDSILFSQPESQQDQSLQIPKQEQSPLSLAERIKLSFADDPGRMSYLQSKFPFVERLPNGKMAVGNDPRSLMPIDPQGFLNDVLGDAADIVGEIPVMGGQIAGATAGAGAGPGGIIAGGGAGAGLGHVARTEIGKKLGVNTGEEEATDALLIGALGAGSEALVLGAKAVSEGMIKPFLKRGMDKLVQSNSEVAPNVLSKLFKITAGIDENATQTAAKYGFNETLRKPYLNENYSVDLGRRIVDDIDKSKKLFGQEVDQAASRLIQKTNNGKIVDLSDTFKQLTDDLKEIGVLESGNYVNRSSTIKGREVFTKLLDRMGETRYVSEEKIGRFGKPVGKQSIKQFVASDKKFSVGQVLQMKREFQDAFPQMSDEGKRVLFRFLNSFDDFTAQPTRGLAGKLAEVGMKVGDESLPAANSKFSALLQAVNELKKHGMKLDDEVSIQQSLASFKNQVPAIKELVAKIDQMTPFQNFTNDIEKYSAAQAFKGANPNLLRVGAILSYVGFGGDQSGQSKLARFATGVALTTPAGARMLLKGGEKLSGKVGAIARSAGQRSAKESVSKYGPALIRALLSQNERTRSRQSANK